MIHHLLTVLTLSATTLTTAGTPTPATAGTPAAYAGKTYRGKTLLPTGTRLITVKADGPWTLTRR